MSSKLNEAFRLKEVFPDNPKLNETVADLLLEFGLGHVIDAIVGMLENPQNPGTQPMRDPEVLGVLKKLSVKLEKEEMSS